MPLRFECGLTSLDPDAYVVREGERTGICEIEVTV
jgi:hypothetical protein